MCHSKKCFVVKHLLTFFVLNGCFNFGSLTSLHYNCESRLYLQWSCKVSLLPLRAARLSHKFNVHSVLLRPGGHFIIITINILIIMTIIIIILIITSLHWFFLIPQKLVEPGNPGCVQYVLVGEGGQLTPLGPLLQVCVCVCVCIILLSSPGICHLLLCVFGCDTLSIPSFISYRYRVALQT